MKKILTLLFLSIVWVSSYAQFTRLHVKSPVGANYGITAEAPANNRIITLTHNGTAGAISTTSVSGSNYSPLQFFTSGSMRMVIKENGFVGIGTADPSSELTVSGKIYGREVKVNVTAGTVPDYVFTHNYKLLPLRELESYIQVHHHLPEVLSAKEMEKEGMNVAEMNLLLLKKIEELTLHIIEQEKKMEKLSESVEKQAAELQQLKSNK